MNPLTKRFGKSTGDKESLNPRLAEINAQWERIFPAVRARSGTQVREFLQDLRKEDIGIYNAIYWRVDNWLLTRTAIAPLSESEAERWYTKENIGGPRLAKLVGEITGQGKINKGWWQTKDLPHIFSKIS